jgi:NADH-quinone oxidoreductase subunit N
MAVLLLEAFVSRGVARAGEPARRARVERRVGIALAFVALLSLFVAVAVVSLLLGQSEPIALRVGSPMLEVDALSGLAMLVLALAGLLSIGLAATYLDALHIHHGEYYALLLLSLTGMFVAVAAENLLVLLLALELMNIPLHVLAGFDRRKLRSNEAGLKHFVSSAFGSAILLYGMALIYGASGALDYAAVAERLDPQSPLALVGLGLVLVGLASKIGLVPFHQWLPDVHEGAPTPVSAFLSVAVPTTALLVLLRLGLHALPAFADRLGPVFAALSLASILVGGLMTSVQRNIKRMLAWSGVVQVGTLLVTLVAASPEAQSALYLYLCVFTFANLGAFGVVLTLAAAGRECERIEDFAGLGRAQPGIAATMTLFLLALVGVPGTAGFWAKWYLLAAAVGSGQLLLAAAVLMGALACLYCHMQVVITMYVHDAPATVPAAPSTSELAVLGVCAAVILWLGFLPDSPPLGGAGGLLEAVQSLAQRSWP